MGLVVCWSSPPSLTPPWSHLSPFSATVWVFITLWGTVTFLKSSLSHDYVGIKVIHLRPNLGNGRRSPLMDTHLGHSSPCFLPDIPSSSVLYKEGLSGVWRCWQREGPLSWSLWQPSYLSCSSQKSQLGRARKSYVLLVDWLYLSLVARSLESSISANGMENTGRKEKNFLKNIFPAKYWLKILFHKVSEVSTAFFLVFQDRRGSVSLCSLGQTDPDCKPFYNSRWFVSVTQFPHLYNGDDNTYLIIIKR